jgi:hypothetical protein
MNMSAPAGIVKNINQGNAAKPQFPSFASGPQKTSERNAPAINGDTAKSGAMSIMLNPVLNRKVFRFSLFSIWSPSENSTYKQWERSMILNLPWLNLQSSK